MKYPILAKVMQAPGKGGKMTNRAFNASTGEDITRDIVYVTLKSALDKGMYLYKDKSKKMRPGPMWGQASAPYPPPPRP